MTTPTSELTGAALLREAARQMQERAQGVLLAQGTPDAWYDADELAGHLEYGGISSESIDPDSRHIASWHPAVALAVADWLDTSGADLWAHGPLHCAEGCHECDDDLWMHHARRALAVARAYLGLS